MLNRNPIFIVGLSRGGSSVMLNIFRSHPDVCSPRGETQEVFGGKGNEPLATQLAKRLRYLPVVFRQGEDVFSMRRFRPRRPLRPQSGERIDRVLFEEKLRATDTTQNRYKSEGVEYTPEEIRCTRLLCKNLDALAFTTELFADMYPDATFFGLVRNGLAVCEGHVRRGGSAEGYGRLYAAVAGRIAADAERLDNFHIVRYETLTTDTLETVADVFAKSRLDPTAVEKFRLVVGDGARTGGSAERLEWYTPEAFAEVVAPRFNEEQIRKLPGAARDAFLRHAGDAMRQLGYL